MINVLKDNENVYSTGQYKYLEQGRRHQYENIF